MLKRIFRYKRIWLILLAPLGLLLTLAARVESSWVETIHARYVYPLFANSLGWLLSLVPFSVLEILILLLLAGVIVHDLAKIGELNAMPETGIVTDYSADGMLIGHLVRGLARLDAAGKALGCDEEILMMLEHMVLSHHGVPEYGSPKPPMFPEAEVLHHLDLLDARIFEMNAALARVRPGGFSEKLWSLDRKLYRRKGEKLAVREE